MPFDPYHRWLGIPPEEQPPSHYRLLGIREFESCEDVIANAADRQMTYLRTFQTGRHAQASQDILNEIAAARTCLLTPERKSGYDAELRRRQAPSAKVTESRTASSPPPLPVLGHSGETPLPSPPAPGDRAAHETPLPGVSAGPGGELPVVPPPTPVSGPPPGVPMSSSGPTSPGDPVSPDVPVPTGIPVSPSVPMAAPAPTTPDYNLAPQEVVAKPSAPPLEYGPTEYGRQQNPAAYGPQQDSWYGSAPSAPHPYGALPAKEMKPRPLAASDNSARVILLALLGAGAAFAAVVLLAIGLVATLLFRGGDDVSVASGDSMLKAAADNALPGDTRSAASETATMGKEDGEDSPSIGTTSSVAPGSSSGSESAATTSSTGGTSPGSKGFSSSATDPFEAPAGSRPATGRAFSGATSSTGGRFIRGPGASSTPATSGTTIAPESGTTNVSRSSTSGGTSSSVTITNGSSRPTASSTTRSTTARSATPGRSIPGAPYGGSTIGRLPSGSPSIPGSSIIPRRTSSIGSSYSGSKQQPPTSQEDLRTVAETKIALNDEFKAITATNTQLRRSNTQALLSKAQAESDPLRKYAMLEQTYDQAVVLGNYRVAKQALAEITSRFDVDVLERRTAFVKDMVSKAGRYTDRTSVFKDAMQLVDTAIAEERFAEAESLLSIAEGQARLTRSSVLIGQAKQKRIAVNNAKHAARDSAETSP